MAENGLSQLRNKIRKLSGKIFSPQVGVFLIFLAIAAVLWCVTTLNEEMQRELTCNVRVTHVPDSVTFIKEPPTSVTVSVHGRGTHLIRDFFTDPPTVDIDFRDFVKGQRFSLTRRELVDLIQSKFGDARQVQDVFPDTIGVYFTTLPPIRVPVDVRVKADVAPNTYMVEPPVSLTDSVEVYSINIAGQQLRSIPTVDLTLNEVAQSRTIRVPLEIPNGCRVIPDSVDVRVEVEPYVTEVKEMSIQAVNVASGYEVELIPETVKVSFRVPKSQRNDLPSIRVLADFRNVDGASEQEEIPIRVEPWESNVFLEKDSIKYFIFRKNTR